MHLHLRALAASLAESGPDREEDVRTLLETARGASPLDPGVRLTLLGRGDTTVSSGSSRDVVALHLQANRLAREGKLAPP